MRRKASDVLTALFFTVAMLATSYFSFGIWTTFIFSFGFLGGFVLWLFFPGVTAYSLLKGPYYLTLASFLFLHKVEENIAKFQERLSEITGHPVPAINSPALIVLLFLTVGGWLLVPFLIKRRYQFGYYLAWSFFASMGIVELAHFIFPFFIEGPYGYFPGMASVFVLAPAAWWGMWRLVRYRYGEQ